MGDSPPSERTLRAKPRAIVRVLKGFLVSSSEMVLAVAMVVVLALVFLGILVLSFPEGTGLEDLYADFVGEGGRGGTREWHRDAGDTAPFVAVLTNVRRKVRDRTASTIVWSDAHAGMQLEEHHTVQTLARSGATIAVGETGDLELGERSLVVIKRDDERRGLRRRRTSVVLLGGRVEGNLAAREGRSSLLDVVTPGGTSAIRSTERHDTEFSVAMNDDESSTLSVYSGKAEITSAGESMTVGPNEAITFDAAGLPLRTDRIPDSPRLRSPDNGEMRRFGAVAPKIRFRWDGPEEATSYRFVLARDRELTDVVYAGEVTRPEFSHGNLAAGRYYWSVKTVSQKTESRPTGVRSLRLAQDLEPPELEVELPAEIVRTAQIVVRGTAEPGSELFIRNETVPLGDDGEFEYTIKLNPGLNMIVVEAVDEAGNSAYRSQYVTARFESGGGS